MKAVHLLVVAIFTFTFALSALSGNALAASEKKEVTAAPVDKVKVTPDDKNSATKATKDIPKDVNINTADKEMLILLPGIGPVATNKI